MIQTPLIPPTQTVEELNQSLRRALSQLVRSINNETINKPLDVNGQRVVGMNDPQQDRDGVNLRTLKGTIDQRIKDLTPKIISQSVSSGSISVGGREFGIKNLNTGPYGGSVKLDQALHNGVVVTPLDWGAKGDATYCAGSMTNGSPILSVTGTTLTMEDIGKVIGVAGAGVAGAPLVGTIAGYTNSSTCTLSVSASTTVSGVSTLYGTDDTTAVQDALNASSSVYLPTDYCFLTGPLYISRQGQMLWSLGFNPVLWNGTSYRGGNLVMKPGGGTNPLVWFQDCYYSRIWGVTMNGSKEFQTSSSGYSLLLVRNCAYSNFNGMKIVNSKVNGVNLENWSSSSGGYSVMADEVNFTDCWILSHDGFGVVEQAGGTSIQSPGDETWQGCHINFNSLGGYYKAYGSFTKLYGCEILTNEDHGAQFLQTVGCKIEGCSIRYNAKHGVYMSGTASTSLGRGHNLLGNHFHLNSRGNPGITAFRFSNLYLDTLDGAMVTGNNCTDLAFTPQAAYGIEIVNCTQIRLGFNNCDSTQLVTGGYYLSGGSDIESTCNVGIPGGVLA